MPSQSHEKSASADPIIAIVRAGQDELLVRGLGKFAYAAVGGRVGMTANGVKWWAGSPYWLAGQCADAAIVRYAGAFSIANGTPQERLETAVEQFGNHLRGGEIAGRTGVLSLDLYRQAIGGSHEQEQLLRLVDQACGKAPTDRGSPDARMVVALFDGAVGLEPTLPGVELNRFTSTLKTVLCDGLSRSPHLFPEEYFHPCASEVASPDERAQIMRVATRHAIDRDPKGFRIEAIAKEMGVSKTLVYKHFKDGQALICAVLAESLAVARWIVGRRPGPGVERWQHLAGITSSLADERQAGRLILDERLLVDLPAEARDRLREAFQKLKSELAAMVRPLSEIGAIQGFRPDWIVAVLLAAINGAYGAERRELPAYMRSLFVGVLQT